MDREVRQRVYRDEAAWREIFARQAASGLLISQFCRQEKITPGVYRRWRTLLLGNPPGARKPRAPAGAATPAPAFVDLGALKQNGSSRCEVRLELGGGVVLSVVRG
jgi:putative transposase